MASLARLLALLLALACASPAALAASKPRHPFAKLVFGVIGDWGNGPDGDYDPKYYGAGDQADHEYYKTGQVAVGTELGKACQQVGCQFVLNVGDNFYNLGINKDKGVNDPQWQTSFKNVYSAKSLQVPFVGVLGNHDYGVDSPTARHSIQPQFDYTKVDNQWYLPARNYTYRPLNLVRANIIAYDTSSYLNSYIDPTDPNYTKKYNTAELQANSQSDVRAGLASWVKSELTKSRKSGAWTILLGHHALISAADGAYSPLNDTFAPILGDSKASPHFAFNGHDHSLLHWKHNQVAGTDFFCIGASGMAEYVDTPASADAIPGAHFNYWSANHGFAIVELGPRKAKVTIYGLTNTTGSAPYTFNPATVIYTYTKTK